MNLITDFKLLYDRELERLKTEIAAYKNEATLWLISGQISNSAGNLCLHLAGNLNTYIGDGLGHSGYRRNRDMEFSQREGTRDSLLILINETKAAVDKGLSSLADEDLNTDFPLVIWQQPHSTAYTLVNLLWHLGYHIGQINYHRRLLDK